MDSESWWKGWEMGWECRDVPTYYSLAEEELSSCYFCGHFGSRRGMDIRCWDEEFG